VPAGLRRRGDFQRPVAAEKMQAEYKTTRQEAEQLEAEYLPGKIIDSEKTHAPFVRRLCLLISSIAVRTNERAHIGRHLHSPPSAAEANVAAPKVGKDGVTPVKAFMEKHEKNLAVAKAGGVDLHLHGRLHTEGWKSVGQERLCPIREVQNRRLRHQRDKTQHVLWRIENGEYENINRRSLS